jgi:hypothetical protein
VRWEEHEAAWRAEVEAWIGARLVEHGRRLAGHEQLHAAPWSTVLRVATDRGPVWFKANVPALAHEARVTAVLAELRPDLLPEVLATDAKQGWMLVEDAGDRLRELELDHEVWLELLPRYAELQLAAREAVDELLAAGAPDRRLEALPRAFAGLASDYAALQPEGDEALRDEEVEQVRALRPRVADWCAELGALGIPASIQHDDLQDGQVFRRDGRWRFLDWGDASVAHPFLTLHVTLRVLCYRLGLSDDALGPGVERFRAAYLEPWTALAPREELEAALPAALLLGGVGRAIAWRELLSEMPSSEWADAVPGHLRYVLGLLA